MKIDTNAPLWFSSPLEEDDSQKDSEPMQPSRNAFCTTVRTLLNPSSTHSQLNSFIIKTKTKKNIKIYAAWFKGSPTLLLEFLSPKTNTSSCFLLDHLAITRLESPRVIRPLHPDPFTTWHFQNDLKIGLFAALPPTQSTQSTQSPPNHLKPIPKKNHHKRTKTLQHTKTSEYINRSLHRIFTHVKNLKPPQKESTTKLTVSGIPYTHNIQRKPFTTQRQQKLTAWRTCINTIESTRNAVLGLIDVDLPASLSVIVRTSASRNPSNFPTDPTHPLTNVRTGTQSGLFE